jgi:hypothetical protein
MQKTINRSPLACQDAPVSSEPTTQPLKFGMGIWLSDPVYEKIPLPQLFG